MDPMIKYYEIFKKIDDIITFNNVRATCKQFKDVIDYLIKKNKYPRIEIDNLFLRMDYRNKLYLDVTNVSLQNFFGKRAFKLDKLKYLKCDTIDISSFYNRSIKTVLENLHTYKKIILYDTVFEFGTEKNYISSFFKLFVYLKHSKLYITEILCFLYYNTNLILKIQKGLYQNEIKCVFLDKNYELMKVLIELMTTQEAKLSDNPPASIQYIFIDINVPNKDYVQFLIDRKTDLKIEDTQGHTLMYYALKYDYRDIISLLIENGYDVVEYCEECMVDKLSNIEYIKFLIESGIDVNRRDKNHDTILTFIDERYTNLSPIIKLFIENGYDLTVIFSITSVFNDLYLIKYIFGHKDFSLNNYLKDDVFYQTFRYADKNVIEFMLDKLDYIPEDEQEFIRLLIDWRWKDMEMIRQLLRKHKIYIDDEFDRIIENILLNYHEMDITPYDSLDIIKWCIKMGAKLYDKNHTSPHLKNIIEFVYPEHLKFFLENGVICTHFDLDVAIKTFFREDNNEREQTYDMINLILSGVNVDPIMLKNVKEKYYSIVSSPETSLAYGQQIQKLIVLLSKTNASETC
uniref:Ankyrin repeat protein n=1 Tax=viral metagenome TaxID=1070528 RepID=A0A6C0JSG2_9ZZZZ